jgi:predicted PurR-regulated permease PerM
MNDFQLQPLTKSILQLAVISLGVYALYLIKGVVYYALIALYISVLGRPLFRLLQDKTPFEKWIGRTGNATITVLVLGGVTGLILGWFMPLLLEEFSFLNAIPYDKLIASMEDEWQQLNSLMSNLGIDGQRELQKINASLQNFASVEAISGAVQRLVGGVGNIVAGTFSIVFISFFLIREQELAHSFIDYITPKKHHNKVDIIVPQIKRIVTRYSFGILLQITAIFTLLALGMTFIGVQGAVVLALTAAIFNLVPYVGPIIGASLGILLGLGQLYTESVMDPATTVDLVQGFYLLAGLFAFVQLLDNIVFQPFIFSNSVGAHPLEIFIVISIAGTLLGVGGMILAVPAYSIIRVVINTVLDGWNQKV